MDFSDIKKGLTQFVERYDSQTYLGSYRETSRNSLLNEGLSTRANSLWKMAEYVVARFDGSNIPLGSYISGWIQLASNYDNQFLLLEEEQNNWGIYDAQGNRLGGEEEIIKLFEKKRIEAASVKRPPKKIELIRLKAAASFLREAIKTTLTSDSDLRKLLTVKTISITHKSKTLSVNGFRLGVNKEFLPPRSSDYSSDIFWHYEGNTYFLNMEITQDGMEKYLFPTYNDAYRTCFEMCKEGNEYVLYQFVTSQHSYSASADNNKYISYLTALRTKPFMLLAGISGTGKSRIVRKLAQASVTEDLQWKYDPKSVANGFNRWELHKPANFELIQVKPNWHNSLEVVGYKSNIGGAHYEYTPFVEFVARAWKEPEVPFFLCLDEMNLAPVEQYFAEFLSAIESRSMENGFYETDPIIKPFESFDTKDDEGNVIDKLSDRMIAHLVGKLDTQRKSEIADRLRIKGLTLPQNLLVMGTVNMDETTFSFSRKVLDRAMSVVMNEVEYDKFFSGDSEKDVNEMDDITRKLLIDRPIRGLEAKDNEADEVENYLKSINEQLNDTPFKLGYRAANEALLYVSAARYFNPEANIHTVLDEFTMMKILSRIEGDKRSIGELLDEKHLQAVITDVYPKSHEKLVKMAGTLTTKQFVSYWT